MGERSLTKGCQDGDSLEKAKTIHFGVAYNFTSCNAKMKLVTALTDRKKKSIYITDNMLSLSDEKFKHPSFLRNVMPGDGWTRYKIEGFGV